MLIPFLSLALLVVLALMLWRVRQEVRAGRAAAFMLVAQAAWVACWIGETLAGDVGTKLRWDGVTWIPTLLAMAASLWVAETQSARARTERIGAIALVAVTAPIVLWSLYISWRGARPDAHLEQHGAYSSLIYSFTWIETGVALFLLLVVASGAGYVLLTAMRRPPGRRTDAVLLAIGLIGPYFVVDVTYVVGAKWLGQRDVSPLAFALFAPLTTLALLRGRTVELMLVAREQVVEELADAVLVVDAQGRLIDVNAQARALLGTSDAIVGRPTRRVPERRAAPAGDRSRIPARPGRCRRDRGSSTCTSRRCAAPRGATRRWWCCTTSPRFATPTPR